MTRPFGAISRYFEKLAVEGLFPAGKELPPISPAWSPVAHFGGYRGAARPGRVGARQAELLGQAVAESERHREWRVACGLAPDTATGPVPDDPCFVF